MGCVAASVGFSLEEVSEAINRQKHTQARIEPMGDRCAVLKGTNWVFNPVLPHDPALKARLENSFPENLSYEVAMESIIQACIDVHVGADKGCTPAVMKDRFDSLEEAVKAACVNLNEQLRDRGIQFETDAGMTKVEITDIKFQHRVRHGRGNTVTKSRQQETDLFIIFPGDRTSVLQGHATQGDLPNLLKGNLLAEAAGFPSETNKVMATTTASKIKELKELLEYAAIKQEEFDAKKVELLNQM